MKSYNHLYEKTISETNRRYALSQAKHSKRFRKIMKHRHMSDDAAVEQSLDWIVNYENAEHVPVYIYDGITRKERTIIVPTMEELLVQHCIVNAMKPMFCKGMYEHSYASLPGRGAHKGKQVIEKWIKPCVSFQQLKRKVSRYDKYDEKRVYQKLVSLYTAKGGKSHGVELQVRREHSPTDCT